MNTLVKTPIWKIVVKYLLILVGISMYCFAWSVFMVPSKIIGGGVVGLSSVIYYLSGIPMGITNFSINAILLLIGYRILGGKFAINTIIGMTSASLFLNTLHLNDS